MSLDWEPSAVPALASVVRRDPEIVSGTPVFVGTRVPVRTLTDDLVSGYDIDEFRGDCPSVTREQVVTAC